jgi:UDP-N-acetylmuramate--alanine ligase
MDCYESVSELQSVFKRFCQNAERAFVCADEENCKDFGEYTTFGIDNQFSDYQAVNLKEIGERYQFTIQEYGKDLCRVRLKVRGRCNVYNALAAFAVMRSYGFDEKEIVKGLESFTAVKRRFEEIGEYHGANLICDYAHHPKEISSTYQTAKSICKGELYVVFQPHTYSRTKLLMPEFVEILRKIENLIIYKTYPAREYYDVSGDAKTLSENVGGCLYLENYRELKSWVKKTVKLGDTLLFLGAGDIYFIAERMITKMR